MGTLSTIRSVRDARPRVAGAVKLKSQTQLRTKRQNKL